MRPTLPSKESSVLLGQNACGGVVRESLLLSKLAETAEAASKYGGSAFGAELPCFRIAVIPRTIVGQHTHRSLPS